MESPDRKDAPTLPEPGALLGSRPLPAQFWPAGAADAISVMYQSVGYDGAGREISGSVFLPAGAAPAGGWPVVSYAHGTTGLSDLCAPSQVGLTRLEREHVSRWLAAGYVVAATDYEGLATPGPHPYFNGEAVADDVVDIVRAARRLDRRIGRSWLVAGFSQGGHAALFVGLMAARYAPELDFRGTVALAPPVHLPLLISILTANGAAPVSVFPPFLLAGLPTSHPDFDARPFLTDAGDTLIESAMTVTLVEMFRAATRLTNDEVGVTDLHIQPGMNRILHACRVPTVRMDRPVLITAGAADEIVPVAVVERFVRNIEEAGTNVRFVRHDGATHVDLLGAGHQDIIAWTDQRLADEVPVPHFQTATQTSHPTRFSLVDATNDGYLTLDDYEVFALRLVQAFGEPPGSAKALAVRQGYRALWRAVTARSDTDDDGRVSGAEFLRWITSQVAHGDGFDHDIAPLAQAVLTLIDHDQNGTLQATEFRRLLRACDLPDDQVQSVFNAFDRDHDGSVSAPEIVTAVHEFCLDPAPGKPGHWLFGRF
ncbi:MAG: lipase family protein [Pseudonocardiaceae bacterium]